VGYRFVEDAFTADVGFVASGETLDECFTSAAEATLEVMLANPDTLQLHERSPVRVENEALDLALLNFLEELVYYKDTEAVLLRATRVAVAQQSDGLWMVEALLEGEAIDPSRHELSADVKAVTVHRLDVRRTDSGWQATVVLDI
jgi:SHS2 domain-containing protein